MVRQKGFIDAKPFSAKIKSYKFFFLRSRIRNFRFEYIYQTSRKIFQEIYFKNVCYNKFDFGYCGYIFGKYFKSGIFQKKYVKRSPFKKKVSVYIVRRTFIVCSLKRAQVYTSKCRHLLSSAQM